ncbi:hypothetical protein ATCC90586_007891 [Pythium insidiosum]|nr:hypothetical protein ATCC90586_007891 [Pythium insidiosum]
MADSTQSRKRKRSPHGCVNAANDGLVEELKKIRGRVRESSHLAANYGRAITSLQNHPDAITSAREAKQLKNIGNYIANQIQSILHKRQRACSHGGAGPTPRPTPPPTSTPTPTPTLVAAPTTDRPARPRPGAEREYAPAKGKRTCMRSLLFVLVLARCSGREAHWKAAEPWFVLQALGREKATSDDAAVTVELLLRSMQVAGYDGNLGKLRACLASMATTYQVVRRTSAGGVFLSERGQRSLALCSAASSDAIAAPQRATAPIDAATNTQPIIHRSDSSCIVLSDTDGSNLSDAETVRAIESDDCDEWQGDDTGELFVETESRLHDLSRPSDEWEIVLVLDHREILSRRNRDILERKLLENNVTCEVRSLNVGDVQWVARRYRGATTDEFMLNVIVERKEVRDLSGSIIDRRYNEQKTRLRDSGLTHVIYLIEGSLTQQTTVRSSGLQTAMCRTQLQNQFFVQLCQNADETVAFLRGVHRRLLLALPPQLICRNPERAKPSPTTSMQHFERQFCAPLRTFAEFNAQFRKRTDFTVSELYQMMLMQVNGLSSARTVALATKYPTFQHLVTAIERQEAIQDLRYGDSQRRFGAKTHEFLSYLLRARDYEVDTPTHLTPQP